MKVNNHKAAKDNFTVGLQDLVIQGCILGGRSEVIVINLTMYYNCGLEQPEIIINSTTTLERY